MDTFSLFEIEIDEEKNVMQIDFDRFLSRLSIYHTSSKENDHFDVAI